MTPDLQQRQQRLGRQRRWLPLALVLVVIAALFFVVLSYQSQIIGNQATIKSQDSVLLSNQKSGRALLKYEIRLGEISIANQRSLGARVHAKVMPAPPDPKTPPLRVFEGS